MNGIIVDIILFIIILGNAILCYKKGLTQVLFNLFSGIIALVLVFILYKPTLNFVINNTDFENKLENNFEQKMEGLFEKNSIENKEQLEKNNMLSVFIGDEIDTLIDNTREEMIHQLSKQIATKVISILVFWILFVVIRLVLYLLKNYIDMIADLPIINVVNGIGGMIYGIILGFFVIYMLFALLTLILPIISNTIIITAIENSFIGSKMFNNNIILNILFKFL